MPSSARPWWLLAPASVSPLWWMIIAPLILAIDYVLGLPFEFTAVYIVPVTMAAWYSGRGAGIALAAGFPLSRYLLLSVLHTRPTATVTQNTITCLAVFGFLALVFARFAQHERRLERQIRVLEGLLPICAICKSIRDARGQWTRLEAFIQERSDARFSHGLCPGCIASQYAEGAMRIPSVRAEIASAADRLD
jgi:hypothetical protein